MADPSAELSRTFLRIPTKLPATVFLDGKPHQKVVISDLSSTGLSFIAPKDDVLPSTLELRFRLNRFSPIINAGVEPQNKADIQNGIRVGCAFLQISKKDEQRINNYLSRLLNFSLADTIMFMAAFFCFIDVLWRVVVYSMNGWYVGTGFGRDAGVDPLPFLYKAALGYYVLTSFAAAAVTADIIKMTGLIRFRVSLTLLIASFSYLVWKSVGYIRHALWNSDHFIVKAVFWWDIFLLCYVAGSILISFALFEKARFILSAIKKHNKGKQSKTDV